MSYMQRFHFLLNIFFCSHHFKLFKKKAEPLLKFFMIRDFTYRADPTIVS